MKSYRIPLLLIGFSLGLWPCLTVHASHCNGSQYDFRQGQEIHAQYIQGTGLCPPVCLQEQHYFYYGAVSSCPTDHKAHQALAEVYQQLGQYSEAIAQYRRLIELQPRQPFHFWQLGDLYSHVQKDALAIQAYEQGLQQDPHNSRARSQRDLVEQRLRGNQVSGEVLARVLDAGPKMRMMGVVGQRGNRSTERRFPAQIHFHTGKHALTAQSRQQLKQFSAGLIELLREKEVALLIEGHTDLRGPAHINQILSEQRARSVTEYLIQSHHLPAERIAFRGLGEERPRRRGRQKRDHYLNRRVEFVRVPRLKLEKLVQNGLADQMCECHRARSQPYQVGVEIYYEDSLSNPQLLFSNHGKNQNVLPELQSEDGYRIHFRPQQDAFIYLYQIDAKGVFEPLWPTLQKGRAAAFVRASQLRSVPNADHWLELDDTVGREHIYVVAAKYPRRDIEDLFRRHDRHTPKSSANPPAPRIGAGSRPPLLQEKDIVMKMMGVRKVRGNKRPADEEAAQEEGPPIEVRHQGELGVTYRLSFLHQPKTSK